MSKAKPKGLNKRLSDYKRQARSGGGATSTKHTFTPPQARRTMKKARRSGWPNGSGWA